jgi:hypothetical protein
MLIAYDYETKSSIVIPQKWPDLITGLKKVQRKADWT